MSAAYRLGNGLSDSADVGLREPGDRGGTAQAPSFLVISRHSSGSPHPRAICKNMKTSDLQNYRSQVIDFQYLGLRRDCSQQRRQEELRSLPEGHYRVLLA